jgi:hypothetical protein
MQESVRSRKQAARNFQAKSRRVRPWDRRCANPHRTGVSSRLALNPVRLRERAGYFSGSISSRSRWHADCLPEGEEFWPVLQACFVMARISLALYLVLSTAVGPALCCCVPGDLLALRTSAKQSSASCHRCCGHDGAKHSHLPMTSPAPRGPIPAPEKDCLCKAGQPQPVVLTPSAKAPTSEEIRSLVPQSAALSLSLVGPTTVIAGQAPTGSIFCPFRTSRDILRALHILRC